MQWHDSYNEGVNYSKTKTLALSGSRSQVQDCDVTYDIDTDPEGQLYAGINVISETEDDDYDLQV